MMNRQRKPNIYTHMYTYFYLLQCDRSKSIHSFFRQILNAPTKVGWVGSGCSVATEPTAELTQFYNITQVSSIIYLVQIQYSQWPHGVVFVTLEQCPLTFFFTDQISCISGSPTLANRNAFRYTFIIAM